MRIANILKKRRSCSYNQQTSVKDKKNVQMSQLKRFMLHIMYRIKRSDTYYISSINLFTRIGEEARDMIC